jgi:hypothetical protein
MMTRRSALLGLVGYPAVSALCAAGECSPKPPEAAVAPAARVVASPSELFPGDLKRLQPHLRLTGGCVRLDFEGPDLFVGEEVELWLDGKPARWLSRSMTRLAKGPSEVSISLKELAAAGEAPRYEVIWSISGDPGGATASPVLVDGLRPGPMGSSSHVEALKRPMPLLEGKPVPVWAYAAGENGSRRGTPDTVEGWAAAAKWAVVLKVSWEEAKDR